VGSAPTFDQFSGRKKLSPRAIQAVARIVREFRPDVLHAFTPSSLAWSVLGTAGMEAPPALISFRGIPRPLHAMDPSEWISFLSPRIAMHACESQAVCDQMIRSGIEASRCRVVYNATWEYEGGRTRAEWRSAWGVDEETFLIGTVGHIRPVKGVDVLLQALASMQEVPQWKVVLCGPIDDPNVARWIGSDALRGRIVTPGHIAPAPSAMQAMDLFVMPSRSEGLCRALIEAMMVGLCPIVSDAGGMKELVRHGRDGLVFPSEQVQALEQAIRTLMRDSEMRIRMAHSAAEHVRTLCTAGIVVDKLLAMYQEVRNDGTRGTTEHPMRTQ
jgi:glycosyltransferase involved in cell wall biosynthesis